jgi:hypothetical protein
VAGEHEEEEEDFGDEEGDELALEAGADTDREDRGQFEGMGE